MHTNSSNLPLKSLNKASYKISKPFHPPNPNPSRAPPPPPPPAEPPAPQPAVTSGGAAAPPPQPPVYNIDKNDFRDVVQKLTGSTAHHQIRSPPPPPPPPGDAAPPPRLHRIRPPPLASLVPAVPAAAATVDPWTRPPLSPLPPLPTVSAAAESPISAYMRRLRGGPAAAPSGLPSSPLGFGCLPSPRTAAYQMLVLPTSPGVQVPSPRLGEP